MGGAEKVIPAYIEPRNNPSIPNEQKQIFAERMNDQAKTDRPPQNQLINLQVYQPPQKPREPKAMDPLSFMPSYTTNPYFPPQMGMSYLHPPFMMAGMMPQMPIIKNYHIATDGPADSHVKLNMIYEDVLPTKYVSTSGTTLGERLTQLNFVRTVMFTSGDGSNMNLSGGSSDSLLEHVKFLELNPYNTYKFSSNPYRGLPDGFLIYRSCYPIRQNEMDSKTICARNSMGVNIRIYKLTEGAYMLHRTDKTKYHEYDQWRDIAYYEFIREHIIKRKICPNFVALYGYYICENSGIDFIKVAELRNEGTPTESTEKTAPKISIEDALDKYVSSMTVVQKGVTGAEVAVPQYTEKAPDMNEYTGKALVGMTESANYNLFGWASRTYQIEGNIKRMINTGYHPEKTWMSILFQLMVALYVLQINGVVLNNFSLENNVYIKDVTSGGAVTAHWKYKVNGIDYYIPNYGYILMVDSNYKDLDSFTPTQFIKSSHLGKKIDGSIFGEGNSISDKDIKQKTFEMFKRAFDADNFGQDFVNNGGSKPPSDVLRVLNLIKTECEADKNYSIGIYIEKYMRIFLNNRVGTYLKEQEITNIRRDDMRDFSKGNILVHEEGSGQYRFVVFMGTTDGTAKILTKSEHTDVDIIDKPVPVTALLSYSKAESIAQNFKISEASLNDDDLLETYVIMGK
jgi:hypothetical protein